MNFLDAAGLARFFAGLGQKFAALSHTHGTSDIEDGAITTDKLANMCVTTSKLGNKCVANGNLGDMSVQEGKLYPQAVTTAKIRDGAVTEAKLDSDVAGKLQNGINAYGSAHENIMPFAWMPIASRSYLNGNFNVNSGYWHTLGVASGAGKVGLIKRDTNGAAIYNWYSLEAYGADSDGSGSGDTGDTVIMFAPAADQGLSTSSTYTLLVEISNPRVLAGQDSTWQPWPDAASAVTLSLAQDGNVAADKSQFEDCSDSYQIVRTGGKTTYRFTLTSKANVAAYNGQRLVGICFTIPQHTRFSCYIRAALYAGTYTGEYTNPEFPYYRWQVDAERMAPNAIATAHVQDGAITLDKLAPEVRALLGAQ